MCVRTDRRISVGPGRGMVPPAGLSPVRRRGGRGTTAVATPVRGASEEVQPAGRPVSRGYGVRGRPPRGSWWRSVAKAAGYEAARRLPRKSTPGPFPETGGGGSTVAKLWAPRPSKARTLLSTVPGVCRRGLSRYHRARREGRRGRTADGAPAGSPRLGEGELPPPWRVVSRGRLLGVLSRGAARRRHYCPPISAASLRPASDSGRAPPGSRAGRGRQ